MPEMADVEVLKRRFQKEIEGQTVTGVKILNPALVKAPDLEEKLKGHKIGTSERYGKYLFIQIGSGWMVMHFGLTGHLYFEKEIPVKFSPDTMLVISTNQSHLVYKAGIHVFGSIDWCESPESFIREKKLGPDAGAVSEAEFLKIFEGSRGAVKNAIMDQHKMAGVGNVYADEILFQARVHPKAALKDLSRDQLEEIHHQIHRVHEAAVKVNAVRTQMPEWAMMRVRKTTRLCPHCGGKMQTLQISNRETLVCSKCQPLAGV